MAKIANSPLQNCYRHLSQIEVNWKCIFVDDTFPIQRKKFRDGLGLKNEKNDSSQILREIDFNIFKILKDANFDYFIGCE